MNILENFPILEKKLGISFKNKDLLKRAFCHRSYLNENPNFELGHNERLEFLGDAVLELTVTENLFNNFPEKAEGELTNWRASLVNSSSLSETARNLEFNDFLLLSKGEAKETGKSRQFILENTFESFIGALFLDQGLDVVRSFIKKVLMTKLPNIIEKGLYKDAKSNFQEASQEKTGITPHYKVLKEWGPDHKKKFIVGIFLEDKLIAEGEGTSKNEAEQDAASNAIKIKNW